MKARHCANCKKPLRQPKRGRWPVYCGSRCRWAAWDRANPRTKALKAS